MKQVLNDFVEGSATEKLSIIANFSTILGVSVATFVAGPFLSKFTDMKFVVTDFIIAIIFYFIYISLCASGFYSVSVDIIKKYKNKSYSETVGLIIFILFLVWTSFALFPYSKYFTGNMFNNSYLLPPPAKVAVTEIHDVSINKNEDILTIKGRVTFANNIIPSDYNMVIYGVLDDGVYIGFKLVNNDNTFELSDNSQFTLPVNIKYKDIKDIHLVVYRKSDWSLLDATEIGYPNNMTQIPNSEMDDLGVFIHKPKT